MICMELEDMIQSLEERLKKQESIKARVLLKNAISTLKDLKEREEEIA